MSSSPKLRGSRAGRQAWAGCGCGSGGGADTTVAVEAAGNTAQFSSKGTTAAPMAEGCSHSASCIAAAATC